MSTIRKYRRVPEYVEAGRFTYQIQVEARLLSWLEQYGIQPEITEGFLRLKHPSGFVQYAQRGYYIVRDSQGEFSTMPELEFHKRFRE